MDLSQTTAPYFIASPQAVPNYDPLSGDSLFPPPGFDSTINTIGAPPPINGAAPTVWQSIKDEVTSLEGSAKQGVEDVYSGSKKIISTVYNDVASGVGTVVTDVSKPITATYWYLILAVVVIGGVIYFAGKSGALKVNAIV